MSAIKSYFHGSPASGFKQPYQENILEGNAI